MESPTHLKDLLLDVYLDLEEESTERLGPEPARQLAVLRSLITEA